MALPKHLKLWLMQSPRPAAIAVTCTDGGTRKLKPPTQKGSAGWLQLAKTIRALSPTRIEALSKNGEIVRVVDAKDKGEREPDDDDEALPLEHAVFLKLLSAFSDHLSNAYRHSTDVAFDKMVAVFEATNKRTESLEKTVAGLQRLVNSLTTRLANAQAGAVPEGDGDGMLSPQELLGQMFSNFMSGQHQGVATAGANGATAPAAEPPEGTNGAS